MFVEFSYTWVLLLLICTLLPLIRSLFEESDVSWLEAYPSTSSTSWVDLLIKLLGFLCITFLVFGLAGIHQKEKKIERTGKGAHIVFVLDRSASMNETFGGKSPAEGELSKSAAAKTILSNFVSARPNDLFGVAAFSTQPFYVSPLTEQKSVIQASIRAIDTEGLAFTNVAKGLGLGLSYFKGQPHTGSRVIVLVSDGAANIDHRAQRVLREWFERYRVRLYWFFLRTKYGLGIFSEPESAKDDNPRVMPERHLHKFFNTLGTPYKAYEVDTPESLEEAISKLDELESKPLVYYETIPLKQLDKLCYSLSLVFLVILIIIKFMEVRFESQ